MPDCSDGEPIRIRVDASKASQKLIHSSMTMPVKPGPLTLLYPQWIPGDHQPVGPIADLVGIKITAAGAPLVWTRDSVDMYAFHLDVPPGITSLSVDLDLILAPEALGVDSSSSSTPQMLVFYWSSILLYPKGTPTDQLNYQASFNIPGAWRYGTALPVDRESDGAITFKASSLTTLADSPVIAGRYFQTLDLNPGGTVPEVIHIAGDSTRSTEVAPELAAACFSDFTVSIGIRVKEDATIKDGEFYSTHRVDYHDGDRYPHLQRDPAKPDLLSEIVKPEAK